MASNTPPLICQPVEIGTPPRGLTGRNTKRKLYSKSDKLQFDNLYEKSILEKLEKNGSEPSNICPDARLCSHERLKDSANHLLCKHCVLEQREDEIRRDEKAFDFYIEKNASANQSRVIRTLLEGYRRHKKKSNIRNIKQFISNTSVTMQDKTIGIASENTYRCNSKCHLSIPLTQARKEKSYTKEKRYETILNYDANILALLAPYMNGTGQRDASMRLSLLDLPASRNFQRNISRHQAFIGGKITDIAQKEIDLALEMEIKETLVNEKGEDYYKEWINKKQGEREKVGLTVSYNIGWNKRSSGNRYDSLSGHAFIIGAYTRRIIGCVIFSKICATCNMRDKK